MTGAELKTLRESLGLSVNWLAEAAEVKERTVRYWESGKTKVPADVEEFLKEAAKLLDTLVNHQEEEVLKIQMQAKDKPAQVVFVRYRSDADLWKYQPDFYQVGKLPATFHAMMLSRLAARLAMRGLPSRMTYLDPEEYDLWLDGRRDSPDMRATWASIQVGKSTNKEL